VPDNLPGVRRPPLLRDRAMVPRGLDVNWTPQPHIFPRVMILPRPSPNPSSQLRNAAGQDPVAGRPDFEGRNYGTAVVEHGHGNRVHGGLMLAEGGRETTLADPCELLEQEVHGGLCARRIGHEPTSKAV